ncbi:hypothetical protein BD626DRAFT_596513 [Schizophyllum amplum]|uniref:Uncharacterized protein n=1 Tax=Schizophyllum amplum TaxID=97359 RepID=A0A550CB90_9AGAR|nr:hypothetical protein BD626DRAFT_596513 [Auriculariopsis ampla]
MPPPPRHVEGEGDATRRRHVSRGHGMPHITSRASFSHGRSSPSSSLTSTGAASRAAISVDDARLCVSHCRHRCGVAIVPCLSLMVSVSSSLRRGRVLASATPRPLGTRETIARPKAAHTATARSAVALCRLCASFFVAASDARSLAGCSRQRGAGPPKRGRRPRITAALRAAVLVFVAQAGARAVIDVDHILGASKHASPSVEQFLDTLTTVPTRSAPCRVTLPLPSVGDEYMYRRPASNPSDEYMYQQGHADNAVHNITAYRIGEDSVGDEYTYRRPASKDAPDRLAALSRRTLSRLNDEYMDFRPASRPSLDLTELAFVVCTMPSLSGASNMRYAISGTRYALGDPTRRRSNISPSREQADSTDVLFVDGDLSAS